MGHLRMRKSTHSGIILKLKHAMQQWLHRLFLVSLAGCKFGYQRWDDRFSIKEGGFAVFTTKDDKPKKFFVALSYLKHPAFVKLLEEAAEEFGFDQPGVLLVPCQASELQSILSI